MDKPILLDVMLEDRYFKQLKYPKRGFPTLIDGEVVEIHDMKDMEAFVEEKLPFLKGRDWSVSLTNQRV